MIDEYGGLAFAGYDDFPPSGDGPKYQRTTLHFWKRLLDGYTVGQAEQAMHDNYDYWIDWYYNTDPPDTAPPGFYRAQAKTLEKLKGMFVVFGDKQARLINYNKTDESNLEVNI